MQGKFFNLNLIVLQFGGLWNPYDTGTWKYTMNKVYSYVVYCMIVVHILTQFANVITSTHDLELMMDGFAVALTYLSMFLKLVPLVWRYTILKDIVLKLNSGILDPGINISPEFEKVLAASSNKGRKLSLFYFSISLVAVTALYVAWFRAVFASASLAETHNGTYLWKPELMYVAKFPCSVNGSFCYSLAVLVQCSAGTNGPMLNVGMDAFVASVVFQVSGHFRVVKLMLKDMDEKIHKPFSCVSVSTLEQKKKRKIYENSGLVLISKKPKQTQTIKQVIDARYLQSCVCYHQMVLSLVEDLNHVFSPLLFAQFLLGGGTISLTIFQLIHISNKAEFYVQFLIILLLQLMIYCWVGEEILQESKEVAQVVFETDWYEKTTDFQKSTAMMISRAQKPSVIHGAGIYKANMETFSAILSTSYSLYTVVNKMKE